MKGRRGSVCGRRVDQSKPVVKLKSSPQGGVNAFAKHSTGTQYNPPKRVQKVPIRVGGGYSRVTLGDATNINRGIRSSGKVVTASAPTYEVKGGTQGERSKGSHDRCQEADHRRLPQQRQSSASQDRRKRRNSGATAHTRASQHNRPRQDHGHPPPQKDTPRNHESQQYIAQQQYTAQQLYTAHTHPPPQKDTPSHQLYTAHNRSPQQDTSYNHPPLEQDTAAHNHPPPQQQTACNHPSQHTAHNHPPPQQQTACNHPSQHTAHNHPPPQQATAYNCPSQQQGNRAQQQTACSHPSQHTVAHTHPSQHENIHTHAGHAQQWCKNNHVPPPLSGVPTPCGRADNFGDMGTAQASEREQPSHMPRKHALDDAYPRSIATTGGTERVDDVDGHGGRQVVHASYASPLSPEKLHVRIARYKMMVSEADKLAHEALDNRMLEQQHAVAEGPIAGTLDGATEDLQRRLQDALAHLHASKAQCDDATLARERAEVARDRAETASERLKLNAERASAREERLTRECAALTAERDAAVDARESTAREREAARSECGKLLEDLEQARGELARAIGERDAAREERERLVAASVESAPHDGKETKFNSGDWDQQAEIWQRTIKKKDRDIESMGAALAEAEGALQHAATQIEVLKRKKGRAKESVVEKSRVSALQRELLVAREAAVTSSKSRDILQQQVQRMAQQLSAQGVRPLSQEEFKALRYPREHVSADDYSAILKENSCMKKEVMLLQDECARLAELVDESTLLSQEYRRDFDECVVDEIQQYRLALEKAELEMERMSSQFEQQVAEVTAEHSRELAALCATHQQAIDRLQEGHTSAVEELMAMRVSSDHQERAHAARLADVRRHLDNERSGCREKLERMESAMSRDNRAATQTEDDGAKDRIKELESHLQKKDAGLHAMRQQLLLLKDKLHEREGIAETSGGEGLC